VLTGAKADGPVVRPGAGCDAVMFWMQPDRDPQPQVTIYHKQVVARCRAAAAELGVDLRLATADEVVVAQRDGQRQVWVAGELLDRQVGFFHTVNQPWPAYRADTWRNLTLFGVLEAVGYCVTIPALHNIQADDKLLTALIERRCGVPSLPTLRLCTRGLDPRTIDPEDYGLQFPLLVKAASWARGMGLMTVSGRPELNATLQLASASELTVILQPWLGPGVTDYRVYVVNGEPYTALARRPSDGGVAGNAAQDGRAQMTGVPPALLEPARRAASVMGLPYVCVDFLEQEGRHWFSEIELDGGTATGGPALTKVRFGAYRQLFDRYREQGAMPRRWRYV
jgi:hypothetical protein